MIHPAAFLAVGAAWVALVVCLVAALPRLASLTVSVAIAQAHAWAAGGWVPILLPHQFAFLAALFVASALMTVLACERSRGENGSRPHLALQRTPAAAAVSGMITPTFGGPVR